MAAPWASVKLPKDMWQRHRVLNTVQKENSEKKRIDKTILK